MATEVNDLAPSGDDAFSRIRVGPRALHDLGWARVLQRLSSLCTTDVGRRRVARTPIWADIAKIRLELARVSEMRTLLRDDARPPLGGIGTVADAIERAGRGSALAGEALLQIADSLRNGSLLRNYLQSRADQVPKLAELAAAIPDLTALARMIYTTFEPTGRVRDDASPRLEDLRRRLQGAVVKAKKALDGMLGAVEYEEQIQDDYYTIRDGRYVLPVKASEKNSFGGILHGHSNTGQTAFIEPTALISVNNDIIEARDEIEREEYAILRDRTDRVIGQLDEIGEMLDTVAAIDHICARALLADELAAHAPELNLKGRIRLDNARNPGLLLKGSRVVPNDIVVGDPWRVLVVTGPNTGGKTVTLLTVGLCTLMAQAGMHVPVGPDSELSVFPRLYTLFGDPQSLEHDLSTFSGHLTAVHQVLREAGPGELVLMDEIIVGTEPAGGAALAIAVLEELATRQAVGVVTTHYDRLKTLSLTDSRFQNASVGMDLATQEPNYELTTGVPGSSSPIEIARKLGLPARIVDRAVEVLGRREQDLQAALEKVELIRVSAAEELESLRAQRRLAEDKQRQLDRERERIRLMGERLARDEQEATLSSLQRARDDVRKLVAKLQASDNLREVEKGRREIERMRTVVKNQVAPAKEAEEDRVADGLRPALFEELREGVAVYLRSLKQLGVIRSTPDSPRKIEVAVGTLRLMVELDEVAIPNRHATRKADADGRATGLRTAKAEGSKGAKTGEAPSPALAVGDDGAPILPPKTSDNSLDLRGQRVDEALDLINSSLDALTLSNQRVLYIVHGHGTGALRRGVREALAKSRYVQSWRPGDRDEGGDGVTVVIVGE